MKKYDWKNEKKFREDVLECNSIADFFRKNDMSISGTGSYKQFKKYIELYDICIKHFTLKNNIQKKNSKNNIQKYIKNNNINELFLNYKEFTAIRKIIKEYELLGNTCSICNIEDKWNGEKLTLQVDHINGINTDNRIENLRLLCPNCHSQTKTWGTKNRNKKYISCLECCNFIESGKNKRKTCSRNCHSIYMSKVASVVNKKQYRVDWDNIDIMQIIKDNKFILLHSAKQIGVSDHALRRRLKKLNLPYKKEDLDKLKNTINK